MLHHSRCCQLSIYNSDSDITIVKSLHNIVAKKFNELKFSPHYSCCQVSNDNRKNEDSTILFCQNYSYQCCITPAVVNCHITTATVR